MTSSKKYELLTAIYNVASRISIMDDPYASDLFNAIRDYETWLAEQERLAHPRRVLYGPPGRQVERPEDCSECGRGAVCEWCAAALRVTTGYTEQHGAETMGRCVLPELPGASPSADHVTDGDHTRW